MKKFPSWPWEEILANHRAILMFLRSCSSDLYQTDSRGSRLSQEVSDHPNLLLSFNEKKNGELYPLIASHTS